MLITFHSAAAADVIMFGKNGQQMLQIVGKDPTERQGIVTVEQLPQAIARLTAAIEADRARQRAANTEDGEVDADGEKPDPAEFIGVAQRGFPLLELLQYSLKEEVPATWDS
jgi:hypothetical protein